MQRFCPGELWQQNVGLGLELEYAARALRKERVEQMLELVGLHDVAHSTRGSSPAA